jgi:hypothetical protein
MASEYGLNFGFRRSDESLRVSEGRFRTPATGSALMIGSCVEIDPANAGFLRVAANGAKPRTGVCGLLVQEEDWNYSIYEASGGDSYTRGVARKNRLSVVTNGPGTKVWFKNTTGVTRADGRTTASVSLVDFTSLVVGSNLKWTGTQWATVAAGDVTAHMEVTSIDAANGYLEAVCLK